MWVTRNKDGCLHLFYYKPYRYENSYWIIDNPNTDKSLLHWEQIVGWWMRLDNNLYPNLKWEDEAIEVELWTKEYWNRTIDDIVQKFIVKEESGNYNSVLEIVNSITEELCG